MATKKTTRKTSKPATKKAVKPAKTTTPAFIGWQFQVEEDSNYPDNLNLTFIKPNNDKWVKADDKLIKPFVKKLMLDPEPIMDGTYSFDGLTVEMVRRECLAAGMTEFVEANTYVPDFSEPVDPNVATGCGGACGGACSGCAPVVYGSDAISTNPADYYFNAVNDPNTGDDYYNITPKAYYDANQALYDQGMAIEPMLETNDFFRLAESCFEFGSGNLQAGKTLLLSLGFTENIAL